MSIHKTDDKKTLKFVILSIGVLFLGGGLGPYLIDHFSAQPISTENVIDEEVTLQVSPPAVADTTQSLPEQNKIQPQIAEVETEKRQPFTTLPTLQDSDQFVFDNLNLSDKKLFASLDIIRNSVVFIDNFSKGELVSKFSPINKPTEPFSVKKLGQNITIGYQSYLRYDAFSDMISQIDVEHFMSLYTHLMPLIDQAYQDIGYPQGSFNNTLNKAINEVLDTPIIHYDIKLKADSVIYKFADDNLELLPDTQKLMLRMGPDNLQIIQNKLEQIQNELQQL